MSMDTIMTNLITGLLPSITQLLMVLIALLGLWIVGMALRDLYYILSDERSMRSGRDATPTSCMLRILIGGLMVVPSAMLWRTADAFLDGGSQTETDVLAYIGGATPTSSCDTFAMSIQLMFLVVGLLAIFFAFRNADDAATGFNPQGNRTAIPYFIGGMLCIFIVDLFALISGAVGIDLGLEQICIALG